MFTINTKQGSNKNGTTTVTAKANGKQRTIKSDPERTVEANHASAVGALLNVLTDDRQQAMLRHPSGGQRVRVESTSDAGGSLRFTINV